MLWDKLAEDLKKISEEVGNYEFEVTHPNEHSTEDIGKATIILEMPIAFRQPEKIRNMFILIGNLLFEHGYRITKSPAISKDFDNPTGKLQAIAKKSIQPPKIKPSSDR